MRRLVRWSLPAALACLALAAAPAANAQEPTIVTDITFPEEGAPFGTFTALDPLCPSGTFVDEFVGGGGAFRSGHVDYGASAILKMFTCTDGSGTFTILFHPQFTPATPGRLPASRPLCRRRRNRRVRATPWPRGLLRFRGRGRPRYRDIHGELQAIADAQPAKLAQRLSNRTRRITAGLTQAR